MPNHHAPGPGPQQAQQPKIMLTPSVARALETGGIAAVRAIVEEANDKHRPKLDSMVDLQKQIVALQKQLNAMRADISGAQSADVVCAIAILQVLDRATVQPPTE